MHLDPTTRTAHVRRTLLARSATALLAVGLAACASSNPAAPGPRALAQLQPKSGSAVAGTISFSPQGQQLRVVARVSGLTPNQEHGFHVHEKGDCSAADATSAGGHFNPTARPHGPQGMPHHGGDMPSLKADAEGKVDTSFVIDGVALGTGGATDLVGRAVVVHAKPDDYTTQPTGNSGGRIACGVIEAGAAPKSM
jgi:Cu-Zn family superoxide dismutase